MGKRNSNNRRNNNNNGGSRKEMNPKEGNRGSFPKQGKQADVCGSQDTTFKSRSNPVSYYTKFNTFAQDAANLPFSLPVGAPVSLNFHARGKGFDATYHAPGIMRLAFMPTVGISKDFTSPINRSSVRFYTYMRSNQKASASYDHQDITMMMMAMDSCYMFHAMCRRLYGIVRDFSPVNLYYAKALVAACGCNYDDLCDHLQDFRAWINQFAYNLGQYAMPKGMTFFDRHQWMTEGIYVDSQTEKAQTYLFVPDGFWKYDNTVSTGSQCVYVPYLERGVEAVKQYTTQQLMDYGDALLNAISNEADFAVISGDIYNFYGGDVQTLPYVDENYQVLPTYDEVVLSQIENATVMGMVNQADQVISQDPSVNHGAIIFQPKMKTNDYYRLPATINLHKDHPTSDDVIEATRLLAVCDANGEVETCGTEIIVETKIMSRNPATGGFRMNPLISNFDHIVKESVTPQTELSLIIDSLLLSQFQHAPQLMLTYEQTMTEGNIHYDVLGTTWDVDNIQTIPTSYLENINLACLLSQFEVDSNRR